MQIVTGMDVYNSLLDASIVTIGNFDGVHRGHAEIFAHLKQKSLDRYIPSVVVTFEPHPLKVLAPDSAPSLITTFDQKAELIEGYGIDYLVVVPFSMELSRMPARDFVLNILCAPLGMRHIIIGHDYAFGRGREGTFATLEYLGGIHGFTLEDLPPIGENGAVYSSSRVRSALAEGDVEAATGVLGRYFQISGTVIHGRKIGHSLGFPTANVSTRNELLPSDGVYSVMVEVAGVLVKGACNIGRNPTFGESVRTIEVFLLDFSGDIYEQVIALHFIQRIRPVFTFPDVDALKSAIRKDIKATRTSLEAVDNSLIRLTQ